MYANPLNKKEALNCFGNTFQNAPNTAKNTGKTQRLTFCLNVQSANLLNKDYYPIN